MKYMGMPWGMWTLFADSFQAQLTDVLGYNEQTAKTITRRAKAKYKEIASTKTFGFKRLVKAFPNMRSIDHKEALERYKNHLKTMKRK